MTEANQSLAINFTPKYLPILDLFKAVHDIRYYLCGVYVEKAPQGGVFLVATDGHSMAVVYDKDGNIDGAENAIVTIDPGMVSAAKKAAKSEGKSGLQYRVIVRGTRAMVAVPGADGMELFIQPGRCLIEAKFPEWRKVMPAFDKLKPGAVADCMVNPSYLARFAKIGTDRFKGIALWQEAPEKPIVVQALALPEAFFVVMPMKGEGALGKFAAFMPPTEKEGEKVEVAEAA